MKRLLFISLILLTTAGSAEQLFTNPPDKSEVKTEAPNPANLNTTWWNHFSVKDENELRIRIKKAEELYQAMKGELGEEDQQSADLLIKRIAANLSSYAEFLKQKPKRLLPKIEKKDTYLFPELIEVALQLREAQNNLEIAREEIDLLNLRITGIQRSYNSLYLKYLNLNEPSTRKFLLGLDLMAQRSRLSVLQQRLKDATIDADFLKEKTVYLNNYLNRIRSHLSSNEESSKKLKAQNQELKKAQERTRLLLLKAEQQVQAPTGDSRTDQSLYQLVKQRVILALVENILANARKSNIEGQLAYIDLINEIPNAISKGNETLERIKRFYDETEAQIISWKRTAELEREAVSKAIAGLESAGTKNPELLKIEQARNQSALDTLQVIQNIDNELFIGNLIEEILQSRLLQMQSMILEKINVTFLSFLIQTRKTLWDWMDATLFSIGEMPVTLFAIIRAIFIIIVALIISKVLRKIIRRISQTRGKIAQPTMYTLLRLMHYVILLLGVLIAFSSIGFTFQNLAIILGALSVGIGFGLQSIVNNFICGVMILFERNIKIGDYVELETGHWGKIVEIKVQSTVIHTNEGIDIFVPNSQIVSTRLINWTRQDPYLRLHVPFVVAYRTDQNKLEKIVCEAAKNLPTTITEKQGIPEPKLWLVGFGDSSLNFELIVWVNILRSSGRNALKASYLSVIEKALIANDIIIPFPQRDIHFKTAAEEFSSYIKKP